MTANHQARNGHLLSSMAAAVQNHSCLNVDSGFAAATINVCDMLIV